MSNMRVVVVLSVVSVALGVPVYQPIIPSYHESVGIPAASRVKDAEQATDFDGARIVGGLAAIPGDYPHLGGLLISLLTGTSLCGSSLISNMHLVTAAHCWWDGQDQALSFEVVLGSLRLFSGGTRITTSEVVMHEHWDPDTVANDIAVVKIPRVEFTDVINSIRLPSGTQLNNDFAAIWTLTAGFGRTSDSSPISSDQVLSHAMLQIITNEECQKTYGPVVTESILCTSSTRGSVCAGDSGGPLQVGGPVLVGISSFLAEAGCEAGLPAGFTRVTSFVPWIQDQLLK